MLTSIYFQSIDWLSDVAYKNLEISSTWPDQRYYPTDYKLMKRRVMFCVQTSYFMLLIATFVQVQSALWFNQCLVDKTCVISTQFLDLHKKIILKTANVPLHLRIKTSLYHNLLPLFQGTSIMKFLAPSHAIVCLLSRCPTSWHALGTSIIRNV